MIKKLMFPFIVALLVLSVSGCAMQSEFVDLENEVNRMKVILLEVQRDVSAMQQTKNPQQDDQIAAEIKERFAKMESGNSGAIDMLQKNQAEFENRLTQLSTDVQIIQGGVEENTHKMAELTESSDDHDASIQEMSRRLDKLESASQPEKSDTMQGSPSASTPSELYNQSYKDYMAGHYDAAIEGFYNYLRQSPTGSLAPNAIYWTGECYYSKGDYTKAVSVFESVTIDYPKSDKVVGALLKMGYGYEKLANNDMAKLYFKKVVEQFPHSQEAALAKVRLAELK